MEKVVPNLEFVGHSTKIIRQSKIKGPVLYLGEKINFDAQIKYLPKWKNGNDII